MNKIILPFAFALCVFASCNKENGSLEVKMTDAAGPYDKVNIDIQGISVKFDKDTAKWVELTPNKGVYDLLQFQNGITTVVATSNNLPTNTVKEVRFVLGTNNTVVVTGVSYPLTMSSQDESGLKVKVSKKLEKTLSTLTIDFDALESIKESSGTYKLKPVLKLK
ncbi:MAG: DUF4382 domain-containing protein [Flavobacteriaceae bacterium]|nr:DUF4382 domain-containing protein [Flavobacteriaceae bacterium]